MKSLPIPEDDTEETCYVVPVITIIQKRRTVLILVHLMIMENTNFVLFTMAEKGVKTSQET